MALSDEGFDLPAISPGAVPESVPLSALGPAYSPRRTGIDPAHLQMLAEIDPARLPPVVVQRSSMRVVDGAHRCAAARRHGRDEIPVRYVDCSDEDAYILAVRLNTLHGLPLAQTDRIIAARNVLAWHPDWSDRAVASLAGVSAKTVKELRDCSDEEMTHLNKRVGRDGKHYPATAGSEGRRRAVDYMTARPDASLREVARAAGISLGTAHDVRARMRRGEDPVLLGRRVAQRPDEGAGREAMASAIVAKLSSDPSLRYSEQGRAFLRWLAARVVRGDEWRGFVEQVPPHWGPELTLIAEAVSAEWHEFAEYLRTADRGDRS
ncbi:ParB N-terminal domain-containing protein [Streptomyces sviceus]|uniref:ParB N-terminal domain-containing protein n=1 Tax=Streptomyces sviceus TaxID=285530 RepID=UPI0036CA7E8E